MDEVTFVNLGSMPELDVSIVWATNGSLDLPYVFNNALFPNNGRFLEYVGNAGVLFKFSASGKAVVFSAEIVNAGLELLKLNPSFVGKTDMLGARLRLVLGVVMLENAAFVFVVIEDFATETFVVGPGWLTTGLLLLYVVLLANDPGFGCMGGCNGVLFDVSCTRESSLY